MSTEPSVNPWRKFTGLLPGNLRAVVTITANNGDGTSQATSRDGTPIVVKGEGVGPGNPALIVDGQISAQVPSLPQTSVEV
jgi:hypothetical protein